MKLLGIEPRAFHALLSAHLAMVFRSAVYGRTTNSPPESVISPWFWVIGQNLIVGIILSLALFARVDAFFFALVGLTVAALITAASMAVEINATVFDPDDQDILGHLPIDAHTYAAVRLTSLASFVFTTSVSVGIVPAIIGGGLRDAGWWFPVEFMLATLALNSIVAASVILLLLFLSRWTSLSQLQELAGWAPTVLILILFYGGQFLLRDKQQSVAFLAYDLPEWTRFFPIAWLAASIAEPPNFLSWVSSGSLLGWLLAASVVWLATFAGLSRFISSWHRYAAGGLSNVQRQLAVPGQLLGKLSTRIIGPPLTQVGYWLSGTMLARDANIKMRCWTSFSFAFAPLVIGLLSGRLGNPLEQPLADSATSIAAIHLVAFSIPGVIAALRYSRDHECVWVLEVSPIANPSPLYDGIGLRFLTHFYLPALAVMSVIWSVLWQAPVQALLHSLVGLTSSAAAYYLCLSLGPLQLPFSQPATTHGWTTDSFRLGIIVGVWTSLAAGLHVAAIQLGLPMIFLPFGLLVVAIIVRMVVQRKGERHAA